MKHGIVEQWNIGMMGISKEIVCFYFVIPRVR